MIDRDFSRSKLTRYTQRAFEVLPEMKHPVILDIGCGTGVPTILLAKLTGGQITGIDIDPLVLQKFEEKITKEKLSGRVRAMLVDLKNLPFDDHAFDLVWAEGSIASIGFERGLKDWKRLIRPGGFLVVHDDASDTAKKLELIKENGFRLLEHFFLSEIAWWEDYYEQLQEEIGEHYLDGGLPLEGEALEIYKEIEMYRKSPERFRSVYFIMQKVS